MAKTASSPAPWQAIEEQAYHAYREWPIWLVLRERELAAHLSLRQDTDPKKERRETARKETQS